MGTSSSEVPRLVARLPAHRQEAGYEYQDVSDKPRHYDECYSFTRVRSGEHEHEGQDYQTRPNETCTQLVDSP